MQRHRSGAPNNRGIGIIELLATIAIFGILLAIGISNFDTRRQGINTAFRQVRADLRLTRARAIVSGTHFGLRVVDDGNYRVERLKKVGDDWEIDVVVRTAKLPEHVTIESDVLELIEFDTRGELVFPDDETVASITPVLTDTKFNTVRTMTVYPSGQIHAES